MHTVKVTDPHLVQWLAAVALLALLALAACNKGGQDSGAAPGGGAAATPPSSSQAAPPEAPAVDPALETAGMEAYQNSGCVKCHGAEMQGGAMAPPLKDLALYWEMAQLEAYLADPAAYAEKDTRLAEQAGKYAMMMPSVPDEAVRKQLAEWLLTK